MKIIKINQTIFLCGTLINQVVRKMCSLLLAAIFAYLYFGGIVTDTLGLVLVILGGVFLLTSLVSFCPLYTLFGLNTCSAKKA